MFIKILIKLKYFHGVTDKRGRYHGHRTIITNMLSLEAKVQSGNLCKGMCASNIPLLHTTTLIVLLHTYPSLKVNNVSPRGDSTVMNDLL